MINSSSIPGYVIQSAALYASESNNEDYCNLFSEEVAGRKKSLNADFMEKANIKDAVKIFQYVTHGGHTAISVSGHPYGFGFSGDIQLDEPGFEKAIAKARCGRHLIWEGRISTTPAKLLKLERKLDNIKENNIPYPALTCSDAACLLLSEANEKVNVPKYIRFSPILTRKWWLKNVDGKNIFKHSVYGEGDLLTKKIIFIEVGLIVTTSLIAFEILKIIGHNTAYFLS